MSKVKLGLRDLSDGDVLALGRNVNTGMGANALIYPTPNPPLATMLSHVTAGEAALALVDQTLQAYQAALVARDNAIGQVAADLTLQGAYVQNASGGDAEKILLAGMAVQSNGAPVGGLPRVLNLLLSEGDHVGYLDLMWKPVKGAASYEIQTSPDPMSDTSWTFKMSVTKSNGTLTGLVSGAKVWVRVRAIGTAGAGDWSDAAMKVVP